MSVSTITPWVIGNWKMNPVQAEALSLVHGIKNLLDTAPITEDKCHIGVAPIAIALNQIQAELSSAVRPIYTVA